MARLVDQIAKELESTYAPIKDLYNRQLSSVDPELQAETAGLEAQKRDSFQQITDAANRRGLFYSGLPIAEEQRYTGTQFLPAVANLKGKYATRRFGLQEAILGLTKEQYDKAQGIREKELAMEAEERRFREQLAAQERASARAARASASSGVSGLDSILSSLLKPQVAPEADQVEVPQTQDQFFSLIRELRQTPGGINKYNAKGVLNEFRNRGILNDAAQQAINAYFYAGTGGPQSRAQQAGGGLTGASRAILGGLRVPGFPQYRRG